jgi:hypothetical protein
LRASQVVQYGVTPALSMAEPTEFDLENDKKMDEVRLNAPYAHLTCVCVPTYQHYAHTFRHTIRARAFHHARHSRCSCFCQFMSPYHLRETTEQCSKREEVLGKLHHLLQGEGGESALATHTDTHTHTHTHTHTNTCIRIDTPLHIHINTHRHTNTQTHTDTHTHTQEYTRTPTHMHTNTHKYTQLHTHTHTHIHTHTHARKYTHTYIHAYIHAHTHK